VNAGRRYIHIEHTLQLALMDASINTKYAYNYYFEPLRPAKPLMAHATKCGTRSQLKQPASEPRTR
jgi:hypothetical protein